MLFSSAPIGVLDESSKPSRLITEAKSKSKIGNLIEIDDEDAPEFVLREVCLVKVKVGSIDQLDRNNN